MKGTLSFSCKRFLFLLYQKHRNQCTYEKLCHYSARTFLAKNDFSRSQPWKKRSSLCLFKSISKVRAPWHSAKRCQRCTWSLQTKRLFLCVLSDVGLFLGLLKFHFCFRMGNPTFSCARGARTFETFCDYSTKNKFCAKYYHNQFVTERILFFQHTVPHVQLAHAHVRSNAPFTVFQSSVFPLLFYRCWVLSTKFFLFISFSLVISAKPSAYELFFPQEH